MLPGVRWFAVEADFPLCYVGVAECFAGRHDEAVVKQAHDAIRRLAFVVEFHVTDQRLVAQRNEIDIVADAFAVVVGNEFSVFGKFDQSADDCRWRDFVEVPLYISAAVWHCDACWLYW